MQCNDSRKFNNPAQEFFFIKWQTAVMKKLFMELISPECDQWNCIQAINNLLEKIRMFSVFQFVKNFATILETLIKLTHQIN